MKIPLIDLVAQYRSIREEIDRAIHGVLESGAFILGPNVAAFEREVATSPSSLMLTFVVT